MSESLLSGRFGEPEGGRLLSQKEKAALENLIRNEVILNQIIINEQTGGGDVEGDTIHKASFEDDGSTLVTDGVLSCTREQTGIYTVTSTEAYGTDGDGDVEAVPVVTPMGQVASPSEVTLNEYLGLTTVNLTDDNSALRIDPEFGRIWATDKAHGPVDGTDPDRVGILEYGSATWEYIDLDDGSGWVSIFQQDGTTLFFDLVNRLAFLQVADGSGNRSTNIYSLDRENGYEVRMRTFDDITHGQANYAIVMAVDPTNNRALMKKDAGLSISTTTNGLPSTGGMGTNVSGSSGVSFTPALTTNGHWWYPNVGLGGSWEDIDGGAATQTNRSGGASGVSDSAAFAYNPVDQHIYFMDNGHDRLKKIDTNTPYTVTIITPSDYDAVDGMTRVSSIRDITWLGWNSDYTKLLAVRGGANPGTFNDFYIVDPSDGSVDFNAPLTATHPYTYADATAAQITGRLWLLGSQRIMEIDYSGPELSEQLVYNPVIAAARMINTTQCQVEFFDAYVYRKRVNSGFHIHIAPIEA